MAYTSKKYYVVNDNYGSELNNYYDSYYSSFPIYKQRGSTSNNNMIIFKENNLPIDDVFPDAPGLAYPVGYVNDTVHPSVDGSNKYVITMTSDIDNDHHPKFYVADDPEDLLDKLHKICESFNIPVGSVALNFVAQNQYVDKVVIGVDSLQQLQQNINMVHHWKEQPEAIARIKAIEVSDQNLLIPANW